MNDIALTGLAKQLVLANLLDENIALQAHTQAQRNKTSLITYLVQNKLVKSRDLATLTSDQFGIALYDLSSIDKEAQPRDLVSEKLVRQHRALPLYRRGNKLYVAISDPSNLQAITDIQFSTGLWLRTTSWATLSRSSSRTPMAAWMISAISTWKMSISSPSTMTRRRMAPATMRMTRP
jgi:hypothetical protein